MRLVSNHIEDHQKSCTFLISSSLLAHREVVRETGNLVASNLGQFLIYILLSVNSWFILLSVIAEASREGFRFRPSLHLAPAIRINLSKTGASLSLGRRGATLNFSRWGTKATAGPLGTGLSYSTMLKLGPPTALPPDESA